MWNREPTGTGYREEVGPEVSLGRDYCYSGVGATANDLSFTTWCVLFNSTQQKMRKGIGEKGTYYRSGVLKSC